ncbi:MAG: recombinase family protein [Oscillospiraceae bacterium]|nr:recombinase family protein [Oscillospiraceae bacterium]
MKQHQSDAVIYARYSSHAQRDVSIEQQIRACRQFAERQGIRIVHVYEDRALTGTSDKRPGFQKMIQDAKTAGWSYVVVYTLDRFARDRYDSAVYKRKLKTAGVRVLSAMENISDDPTGILMESVLEGLAEYYSKELSRKVLRGHEDNARKCMVNGKLPLGFCRGEDGRYAICEPEAELVREIFRRVSSMENLADIIADLNARGMKTKTGGAWNRSSFNQILSNERYTGLYIYHDIRVPGGIPQIVSQEMFDEVQCIMHVKPNPRRDPTGTIPQRRRRDNGTYLLTGKLFCGECRSPMIGVSGTSKTSELHYYYACKGRRDDHGSCHKKNVRRDTIEHFVTAALKDAIFSEDVIPFLADEVMAYQEANSGCAELDLLRSQYADTNRALNNLMSAIEAGIFSATTQARLLELEEKKRDLSRLITAAESAQEHLLTREEIIAALELYRAGDIADKTYQGTIIDTFLINAHMYDDRVRFVFTIGPDRHDITLPFDIDTPSEGSYNVQNGRPLVVLKSIGFQDFF